MGGCSFVKIRAQGLGEGNQSIPHIIKTARVLSFKPQVIEWHAVGAGIVRGLPKEVQGQMRRAVTGKEKVGVACDFDNTLVPTNELKRIFWVLGQDPIKNLQALGALPMINIPVGIISGNTTEYVGARCTEPLRDFILKSPFSAAIQDVATYALNGGFITLFNPVGGENSGAMGSYNSKMRMPSNIHEALYKETVNALLTSGIKPLDKPITIRSGLTTAQVFAPVIEDRAGVEICLAGVPPQVRIAMVNAIKRKFSPRTRRQLNIQPAGQYSIDAMMASLQKKNAGKDFINRFKLDLLFYLGDAVYKKGDAEGNDFSMVHNPNTQVLAVNDGRKNVPTHKQAHWIGAGPEATRNWLVWFLIERANFLYQNHPEKQENIWDIFKYIGYLNVG